MTSFAIYAAAAVAEIAGCFAFWAWFRLGHSALWTLPGVATLVVLALLLTRIDTVFAGRAFAAYGGVYIAASLVWLWTVEGTRPDRWDVTGSAVCLVGAAHGLDPANWTFLTSSPEKPKATRELAERYGLKFSPTKDGYQMHGLVTHLIDKSGNLRALYHGLKFNPVNMVVRINALTNDHH